jgi:hypothetical protein
MTYLSQGIEATQVTAVTQAIEAIRPIIQDLGELIILHPALQPLQLQLHQADQICCQLPHLIHPRPLYNKNHNRQLLNQHQEHKDQQNTMLK